MSAFGNLFQLQTFFARLLVLFLCMPIHEFAHGYVAYKLGDTTARDQGRLTLNPFSHLDWMGALSLLLLGIGWARPVSVDSRYFKHPRRDMALTAAAGPVANLLLGFLLMIVYKALFYWILATGNFGSTIYTVLQVLNMMVQLNIMLAAFNILPIPPLDGSRILAGFLPPRAAYTYLRYEQQIMLVMLVLLFFGVLDTPLIWLQNLLWNGVDLATGFVDGICRSLLL